MKLCLIGFLLQSLNCSITCRNENDKPIDWFIAMKLPKSYNFIYITSGNNPAEWINSTYDLKSDKNIIAVTLRQSYLHCNRKCFYVYYNDDKPNSNNTVKGGHLKGVLNMDETTGLWLTHSVPNFPIENEYFYNQPQSIYGQSFICVSIKNIYLKPIVKQLLMMQASVYSHFLPQLFTDDVELINLLPNLIKNVRSKQPDSNILKFKTINSLELIHFGKSPKYNEDLYSGLIAPSLNDSLFVETWTNGKGGKLDSLCQLKYKVNNVDQINFTNKVYQSKSDHSKWAISQSQKLSYVCIGDINRMKSQFKRGGGSLCISKSEAWQKMFKLITNYEKCSI
nr:deoxyribonuclease 2-1 [Dugesia japonica]